MNKSTKMMYMLPVLAVLGMFSAADAETDQERIDKIQAKIDRLQERIGGLQERIDRLDPATDQKRIDKLEAKVDGLEERIAVLEARISEIEAASSGHGPVSARSVQSDEPRTARQTDLPEADATVTITRDGRFTEDAGTLTVALSESRQFTVKFVNNHDADYTLLIDLMSGGATHPYMHHAGEDLPVASGGEIMHTFTIADDPRVTAGTPGYLVFGVQDIPGTPEREPDTVTGDHLIKIRIAA